jgi:hypothetical protein
MFSSNLFTKEPASKCEVIFALLFSLQTSHGTGSANNFPLSVDSMEVFIGIFINSAFPDSIVNAELPINPKAFTNFLLSGPDFHSQERGQVGRSGLQHYAIPIA